MADTDPEPPPRPPTSPEPDEDDKDDKQDSPSQRDIEDLAARTVIIIGRNGPELVFPPDSSLAGVRPRRSDSLDYEGLLLFIFFTVDEGVQGPRITPAVIVVAPSWVQQRSDYLNGIEAEAKRLAGLMCERVAERISTQVIQPVWNRITLKWATRDFGRFNSAAEFARNLEIWEHSEAGRWLAGVGSAAGVPSGVAGAGVVVGAVVPLPGDRTLGQLAITINLAGVAFALATGNPVLTCASLKSLAHEALIKDVSVKIRDILAARVDPSLDLKRLAKETLRGNQPEPSNQESVRPPDPDDNHGQTPRSGPGPSF